MIVEGAGRSGGAGRAQEPGTRSSTVSVVTVSYGAEPWLERCVQSVLASEDVVVDVVLVDNGCTDGAVDRLRDVPGVSVVDPGGNVGFAAGCNFGAAASSAPVIALVNPDTIVEPGALCALLAALDDPGVGLATCSLRLADDPDLLNSAGNEVHFLGLSWSGSFRVPAAARATTRDVLAASGAGMAIRRELWDEFGGFVEEFFAYQEDAELSLRCWLSGQRVVYAPGSVIVHRYDFSRNPTKFFLLDRNRLIVVLTVYSARMLVLLLPALLVQEAAMFVVAAAEGWLPQRIRSVWWIVRNRRFVRRRRACVGATRRCSDAAIAPLMAKVVQPGNRPLPRWAVVMQAPLVAYWWLVRRLL